jgi:outer membrane protein assembly factor BamB
VTRVFRVRLAAGLAALAVLLGACEKDKDVLPPAQLVPFAAHLSVQRLWETSLGGKDRRLRLALAPAVDGKRLFAAGQDGVVHAYDAANGRVLWQVRTRLGLSAGPGVGGGLVVVGSSDGQLVALDAETGARRWLVRTSGEVLATPVFAPQAVIVRTVDGRVHALTRDTGRELWANEEQVPRLTLRGTSVPVVAGDTVVCGFDNGKVAAYGIANGDLLWDTGVSPPRGKTELERLVDIDGRIEVSGRDVFVAGYQGRVAMLALDSGQAWWSHDLSSYRGLALDGDTLFVSTANSTLEALRRRDGTSIWQQDALIRRGLTTPVVDGEALVVADFEGWVHWLDKSDGKVIGRYLTKKKSRVTNAPLAANGIVYVQTDAGRLYALRATAK